MKPKSSLSKTDPNLIAAAQLLLSHVQDQLEESPTIKDLWEKYFASEGQHLRSADRLSAAWKFFHAIRGTDGIPFEKRQALTIDNAVIEEFRAAMRISPLSGRATKPATRNRMLSVVQRVLHWSHQNGLISHMPIAGVHLEAEHNIPKTKLRTDEEFGRILAHIPVATFRVLLLLLWDTGMRVGEALKLRRVQFSPRINGGGVVELGRDETKTGRARTVFLTRRVAKALESLPDRGPYFFCKPNGGTFSYAYLYRIFALAAERAKLPCAPGETIHLHTLRHSALYRMRTLCHWPQQLCMRQSGHTTTSAFFRYGIADEQEMTTAMDTYESVLQGRLPPRPAHNPHAMESTEDLANADVLAAQK
jgi:integrase